MNDWDNGNNTILRRQTLPPLPATILERLSVRSAVSSEMTKKSHRQFTHDKNNESTTTTETQHNSRNVATSLINVTRELIPTISEVYHERNLGLGLAPSLSKLLEEVSSVPESEENQLSAPTNHCQSRGWLQNDPELCARDEADGRSIAESQCSVSSSKKLLRKALPPPV